MSTQQLSISDAALLTNVKAATLRQWEKRYSLLPPRLPKEHRVYTAAQLQTLLRIMFLHQHGLRLPQIAAYQEQELIQATATALPNGNAYAHFALLLAEAVVHFHEKDFVLVLDKLFQNVPVENVLADVLHPFVRRIEVVWHLPSGVSAQAAFALQLMEQRLAAVAEQQRLLLHPPMIALLAPKPQHNRLSLLHACYSLRSNGYPTIYLGQNITTTALLAVTNLLPIHYVAVYLSHQPLQMDAETYLEDLVRHLPQTKILAFGAGTAAAQRKFLQVRLFPSVVELSALLQTKPML